MDRKRQLEIEAHFEANGWISGACGLCSPVVPNPLCLLCGGLGRIAKRPGLLGNLSYAQYAMRHMQPLAPPAVQRTERRVVR